MPQIDVLLLDGEQRSALTALRSLARRGLKVAVGSHYASSLASVSRFCHDRFIYPSPYASRSDFIDFMSEKVKATPGAVLFPMTDVSVAEILSHRSVLEGLSSIPFVDNGSFETVTDKRRLFELAAQLGIPKPHTIAFDGSGSVDKICKDVSSISGPVVIKPSRSKMNVDGSWISAPVRYARDHAELARHLSEPCFRRLPFIAQEVIEGPGVGVFLLADNGTVVASFAHERIREKPPSGGVSVLSKSIRMPESAYRAADALVRHLNWTGVIMVEFKRDINDMSYKLIEVNARFWGSLQLAISAGVDFPYLLYRLARKERIDPVLTYKEGVRLRWLFGDIDHLVTRFIQARSETYLPTGAPTLARTLADFLCSTIAPNTAYDVWSLSDMAPFLHEACLYAKTTMRSTMGT